MARWLVTDGDRQFSARDIEELKELAKRGEISSGSMIQPPGASDWLYATEVPELRGLARSRPTAADDDDEFTRSSGAGARKLLVVALLVVVIVGGYLFYANAASIPDVSQLSLLGGPNGLELSQMLVTEPSAPLRRSADAGAAVLTHLEKDSRIKLLAKRGPWYQVQSDKGANGWVAIDHVIPAYFFADERERENYDPIYNPDRYLYVSNSRWLQLPAENAKADNVTVFEFRLKNDSKFEMDNIKLMATIKDRNKNVLEQKEITLTGSVPRYDAVAVGTVSPEDKDPDGPKRLMTYHAFSKEAKGMPDEYWLRWADGIEVEMSSSNYVEADIVLLQANAVVKKR